MTYDEINELYHKWWMNRTPDELELHSKILEYEEEYFEDMCFQENSIIHDYLAYTDEEGLEFFDECFYDIQSSKYRFYVKTLDDDTMGETNLPEHTITIAPLYMDDKPVILHEMIHAYANTLNEANPTHKDILLLALYNKLKTKISDIDNHILSHAHNLLQFDVTLTGGYHDVLFFLKSLDLDLRCGYKLGTVCGYGRDKL